MSQANTARSYVILVDDRDQEIGIEEKLAAHQTGQLHRAFSVFIFRKQSAGYELLLQQRNFNKYHSPGLWTNSCCSHPRPGEDLLSSAKNRLNEEMGIEVDLKEAGSFIYKADVGNYLVEHEFDHVFVGFTDLLTLNINQDEVAAYRWIDISSLESELKSQPHQFTSWFKQALDIAINYL